MTNRFPIEFFQELVKKQVSDSDVTTDFDITLVDGDETEDMNSLDKTVEERVQTQKF